MFNNEYLVGPGRQTTMSIQLKPIIERKPQVEAYLHHHPVINRVLQNRGVSAIDEMEYSLSKLVDPWLMKNMEDACKLLHQELLAGSKVVIVGDFDCDGATSTSIAVEGLKALGFKDVHFIIPDRVIHGYGLTPSIVKLAAELEPDLIVTVDNGIASFDGARAVAELERPCKLLITDHHLPADGGQLPTADCIINPNQTGCPFPSKDLAGCGVMFYTIMAFRGYLRKVGYFEQMGIDQPNIMPLIDLVALGTVADVVPLDFNNRILVDAGIKRIRAGHGRHGIMAILEVANKNPAKLVASDFGFAVGPRINAAGRLEDMTQGINCLLSLDYDEALEMATRLDDLNKQRRDIEADHVFDANMLIDQFKLRERKGVVIHDPSWHPGVVGIVASRIKERINRPIICMTDAGSAQEQRPIYERIASEGDAKATAEAYQLLLESEVKGSARSIEGVHLKHVLDHISKKHPEILTKFGGHAMAAGLSLKFKDLERFKQLFDEEIALGVTDEMLLGSIEVDIKNVGPEALSLELAREIREMGPWGQKFPEPTLHGRFKVINTRVLKEKHLKLTVSLEDDPLKKFDAICFNCIEDGELPIGDSFEAAFVLDINEYPPGNEKLQLMLREIQDPVLAKQKALVAEKIASVREETRKDSALNGTVIKQDAPVQPREARINGLPKMERDSNPVSRLSDDMRDIIKQMKENTEPKKHSIDEGIAPF